MRLEAEKLARLESDYSGYLEGTAVDRFLADFEIRFAAGLWCAGEFADRFAPVGYNSDDPTFDRSIPGAIARVRQAGIDGIEFHDMELITDGAADPRKIADAKAAMQQHRIVATNMNFNTWTDPVYKLGGVTNPDRAIRDRALHQIKTGIAIAQEVGCVSCGLWPGSDGWDYHFEVDYGTRLRDFIDACTELAEECDRRGLKFGTEPKPKEPREGAMIINTVGKAALVAKEVNRNLGKSVMGVAIDYGHEQMCGNTPADSLYLLREVGVPIANFHINGAKFNSNDEDRIAGTDDLWRMVEFCYAAIDTGYDGWFGEDQFTYRTEQVISMALSREFFANCMKKALRIYAQKSALHAAQQTGDAVRTIQVVKKVIYNG